MKIIEIEKMISNSRRQKEIFKPVVFDLKRKDHLHRVKKLISAGFVSDAVDEMAEQTRELYFAEFPSKIANKDIYSAGIKGKTDIFSGVWIYYPWRRSIVHCLERHKYNKLRLSRNQDLILTNEQAVLKKLRIGFAGLNVGNPGAVCCALEGVGGEYKFADIDELSVSNLNRFRAGVLDLGLNKAVLSARQVYESDPFAKVKVFENGISPDNIDIFLKNTDILVEETDNLKIKLQLRRAAKKLRIPVVMVTGDGPHVVIDVERYDVGNPKILNGHMSETLQSKIDNFDPAKASAADRVILARDFIGNKFLSRRLNRSFLSFGKSLPSIPQLAESSFLRGALICNTIRKIFTPTYSGIRSGRYHIDLKKLSNKYEG